jgi:hypothetical protein
MSRVIDERELRRFGCVEIHPNEGADAGSFAQASYSCSWCPDRELWRDTLESGAFPLVLRMDCHLDRDGIRHFAPPGDSIAVVMRSAVLGSAILDRFGRTSPADDAYGASSLQLWQSASNLRELFGRRFKRYSDLAILNAARGDHGDVSLTDWESPLDAMPGGGQSRGF